MSTCYRQWKLIGDMDPHNESGMPPRQVDQCNRKIEPIKSLPINTTIIIAGVYNIDHIVENDSRSRGDLIPLYEILEETKNHHNLCQLNYKYTWWRFGRKKSLLDLFYFNIPNHINYIETVHTPFSDHLIVKCQVHMKELEDKKNGNL